MSKSSIAHQCILIIESKLTGQRRQEALSWARGHRTWEQYQAMIKRLEPLPDSGAQHSQTVYSEQTRAAVRADYRAGMKLRDIAAKHGIRTHGTISKICEDLPRRQRKDRAGKHSPATIAAVRREYEAGHPIAEICERHNMVSSTVYGFVADLPKRIKIKGAAK